MTKQKIGSVAQACQCMLLASFAKHVLTPSALVICIECPCKAAGDGSPKSLYLDGPFQNVGLGLWHIVDEETCLCCRVIIQRLVVVGLPTSNMTRDWFDCATLGALVAAPILPSKLFVAEILEVAWRAEVTGELHGFHQRRACHVFKIATDSVCQGRDGPFASEVFADICGTKKLDKKCFMMERL